jgi:phosphatidylethanolamine-binding protein (PEBP) family uncharacterized protein
VAQHVVVGAEDGGALDGLEVPRGQAVEGAANGADGRHEVLDRGAIELPNDTGAIGYFGSCPPTAHVYRWRLWALDAEITPSAGTFDALASEASAHSLGTASLCDIYRP